MDAFNFDPDVWIGASALAERLWSDPPLGKDASASSADAEGRHHNLRCHWAMWGLRTYTRLQSSSEYTAVADATLDAICPAAWSPPPN